MVVFRQKMVSWVTASSFIALFFYSSLGSAMWAKMTDEQLIGKASLIINAELIGTTEIRTPDGHARFLGVLLIEKTYKGDAGLTVVLLALPHPNGPRSSSDVFYETGQKGLWFLQPNRGFDTGIYTAGTPESFWSTDDEKRLVDGLSDLNQK